MHVVVEKDLYFTTKKHIVLDKDTHRVVKFYLIKDDYYYGVFKNETETLSKLVHPNIVSFLGTVMTPTLGIVMEYCERGPISKIIFQQEFEYSLRTILWWAEQLFRAICYLSERDIVHANINHENTLATGSFGLKLAGFGNSRREGEPKNDPITSASDVYSAVILIWEIVEKSEAQFDDEELKHRPFAAKFSHIKDIPLKEPSLFEKLQKLIESGTQLEAKDRTPVFAALLTTKDLRKQHTEWLKLKNGENLCELCLKSYVHDNQMVSTPKIRKVTPMVKLGFFNLKPIIADSKMSGNSREIVFCRRIYTQNPNINQPPIWKIFEGTTLMPINYEPDLDDKHFRDERIPKHCFHELAPRSQAIVIAASFIKKIGQKDESRERVAAKRFDIAELKRNAKQSDKHQGFTFLLRELQNTQFLVHPNIVEMKDSFYESFPNGRPGYVWLVTERMDCSLEFYFERLSKQDNDEKKGPILREHRYLASLLVQLLRALDFLHLRGIMHRDVTPKNIGLNRKDFVIKLLDYGVSEQTNSQRDHTKIVPTPLIYQPLEVILGLGYDCGVDVWAVGLIAFRMLGTKLMYPTDMKREDKVKQRILDVVGLPTNKYEDIFGESLLNEECRPSTLNKEFERAFSRLTRDLDQLNRGNLRNLLENLLSVNPQKRMEPSICLNHSYLQVLNNCLCPLPTADQIKEKNERDEDRLTQLLEIFWRKI